MIINMEKIPVVIMCGGLGTRLESITKGELPKCMVVIKGVPFLHVLIDKIRSYGVKYFLLCLGFKGKIIQDYFEVVFKNTDVKIEYSYDNDGMYKGAEKVRVSLLGTTNALLKVKNKIIQKTLSHNGYNAFLVMNGDTYFGLDLDELVRGCAVSGHMDKFYGCSFSAFTEGLDQIDSGVYFLNISIFNILESNTKCLQDNFRKLLLRNMFCSWRASNERENLLLDIGTLNGYRKTLEYFK